MTTSPLTNEPTVARHRSSSGPSSPVAAGNAKPARISVQSALAQDTVSAADMDISDGANTVALFANPFHEGAEELLYVDEASALRWIRHEYDADGQNATGWTNAVVAEGVTSVVVAVHPDGTVCAFVTTADEGAVRWLALSLTDDVPAREQWLEGGAWTPANGVQGAANLAVQYLSDRPATPVVSFTTPEPRLYVLHSHYPARPEEPVSWEVLGAVPYLNLDDSFVSGLDEAHGRYVRLYDIADGEVVAVTYDCETREITKLDTGVRADGFAGVWNSTVGAGCLAFSYGAEGAGTVITAVWADAESPHERLFAESVTLDQPLQDLVAWQDDQSRLHLYGRGADAGVFVLHQLSSLSGGDGGPARPVWETHATTAGATVGTTRPLFADAGRFQVDAFPDEYPSQHVMHMQAAAGERCSIYTQDVRTTYWCRERVRLEVAPTVKPYSVPRYQSTLRVTDGYGVAVPGASVTITSAAPMDFEHDRRFYRTGPVSAVTLTADLTGRVIIRTSATSLSAQTFTVGLTGTRAGIEVQQGSEVHGFLSGTGVLPNHGTGFTADVVRDARTSTGDPLFPHIAGPGSTADWPPTAEQVVDMCADIMAIGTAASGARAAAARGVRRQEVTGFALQTHDMSQPAYRVVVGGESLAPLVGATAPADVVDDAIDWLGDVFEGIRSGLTTVAQVGVDLLQDVLTIDVVNPDGSLSTLSVLLDDLDNLADGVEAVFSAVGAAIEEAVDWLSWAFDFSDVIDTARALGSCIGSIPTLVNPVFEEYRHIIDGWFLSKEQLVRDMFETLKATVGDVNAANLQVPRQLPAGAATSGGTTTATAASALVDNPHVNWLYEKVQSPGMDGGFTSHAPSSDVITKCLTLISESPAFDDLDVVWDDISQLWQDLIHPDDPKASQSQALVTLLDLVEHAVLAALELLDSVADAVLLVLEGVFDTLAELYDTPLTDSDLLNSLWDWILEAGGVDPDTFPLTAGNLGMLAIAYPATLIFKAVRGEAPFPGGVMPQPPVGGLADAPGQNPSGPLLNGQIFQSIVQCLDAIPDAVLNGAMLMTRADAPVPKQFWMITAWTHAAAYTYYDYPAFWGYDPPSKKDAITDCAYARWVITAIANTSDLLTSHGLGKMTVAIEGFKGGAPSIITLLGWARIITNCVEYSNGPRNWVSQWNLFINIAAYIQTATGFVRKVYEVMPNEVTAVILGVKLLLDSAFDVASGEETLRQILGERLNPPTIDTTSTLPDGKVGTPYAAPAVAVTNGFPPYEWKLLSVDEQTGPPPGVQIFRGTAEDDPRAYFIGTPTTAGTYSFTAQVKDYYGPSFYATKTYTVVVTE